MAAPVTASAPPAARLLLVEDNPGDVRLVREALALCPGPCELTVARDGDQALALLRGPGPRPHLVLLDLQLPRRHGLEVLAALRADPTLAGLPVVVFTSSEAGDDRRRALGLGADAYHPKPAEFDRYLEAVQALWDRWLAPR